ncbi:MAG: hypothetical protein PHP00_12720 [Thiotrichaceae bacterium]|nr:hypothetical protein [Thiotrichaceae bacterium]
MDKTVIEKVSTVIIMSVVTAAVIFFGYQKQPAEMGLMAAFGLMLLFFTQFDKIQSIKGAGIEVQKVVDKAEVTKAELQKVVDETDKKIAELDQLNARIIFIEERLQKIEEKGKMMWEKCEW